MLITHATRAAARPMAATTPEAAAGTTSGPAFGVGVRGFSMLMRVMMSSIYYSPCMLRGRLSLCCATACLFSPFSVVSLPRHRRTAGPIVTGSAEIRTQG